MALLALIVGMVPPAIAWTKKLMIDRVVNFVAEGVTAWAGLEVLIPMLALIFCFQFVFNAGMQGRNLVEKHLSARLSLHINKLIMNKALTLDLGHFEDSQFYDKLQNAQSEADQRAMNVVTLCFQLLQTGMTFLAFLFLLVRFSPWLVAIFFFATVPSFALQSHYGQLNFRLLSGQAPERRRLIYFKEQLTVDRYVKEIKLFGIGGWFIQQYLDEFWPLFRADMKLAKKRSAISLLWGTLGVVGYLGAIGWIIYRAIDQSISFGEAVLYLEVFEQSHYITQDMLRMFLQLHEHSLFVDNLFVFLAIEPKVQSPTQPQPTPAVIQSYIEFRGVSFRYPNQKEWALRNIDLSIHPGEKLALVGLNGAGKTTLIKLLTRLYDPTEGQILIDGVDLRALDPDEWHKQIGVIFQDYVHYHLTAAENIGVGQIDALSDRERIVEAARKGGAHESIESLPNGYDTVLGKWFADGQELSLGQWQKVALSRAFMRDASILILDEPTAALDAEQEYHTFQHFRQLTEGKIAILISHRFSTVRMADRIAVINEGELTELGSHDELIARRGLYAHLFTIQAEGYKA
ncbi:MAG: ABC transporter ATP-binding protein [Anaerolineae bacterium]|nr:ABC transporter ATP-binding protein [Anaerolineae bacterium]